MDAAAELDAEHRELLTARGVRVEALREAVAHAAAKEHAGTKDANVVRVLSWNVLAEGLSNDGFLVNDVLDGEQGERRDVRTEVTEVLHVRERKGSMDALKAKYATQRSMRNHEVVMDWTVRWTRIRATVARMRPDIIVMQEMDHVADAVRNLRTLGYECCLPGGQYRPAHKQGIAKQDPLPYLTHLDATSVAFASKVPSTCRKIALRRGLVDADDDGGLICWKSDAFEAVDLTFLDIEDKLRNEGVVRARLRRKSDGASISVICAHLHSGSKASDEEHRVADVTNPTLGKSGAADAPSVVELFEESLAEGPTLFCLDANSDPDRDNGDTVWKVLHRVEGAQSVWDDYFDLTGKPKGHLRPVTSNKMRGPLSSQPQKIGEHTYQLSDHIFYSPQFTFVRHAWGPLVFNSPRDALNELLPDLGIPSDHVPVVVDLELMTPGRRRSSLPVQSGVPRCLVDDTTYVAGVREQLERSMSDAVTKAIHERAEDPIASVANAMLTSRSPGETRKTIEAAVEHAQREQPARASGRPATPRNAAEWDAKAWVESLGVEGAVAGALLGPLRERLHTVPQQLAFLRHLGAKATDVDGKATIAWLLREGNLVEHMSDALWKGAVALAQQAASTAVELNDKFASNSTQLAYGRLSAFHDGLDGLVGPPQPNVAETMEREHCASPDSDDEFTGHNYGTVTTSRIEYWFVVAPNDEATRCTLPDGVWPQDVKLATNADLRGRARKAVAPEAFAGQLRKLNEELLLLDRRPLQDFEFLSARLYTGPMYVKYNTVLRGRGNRRTVQALFDQFQALTKGNMYTSTLHSINSAIIKLSNLQKVCKVYRGLSGAALPHAFWHADKFNLRCAVDYAFMSTTLNREVAVSYASCSGGAGILFEFSMGMVGRGADLSWLSQYPYEKEILFPPLCGLEVRKSRVEGSMIILELVVTTNMSTLTIEDAVSTMKRSHVQLVDMAYANLRFSGAPIPSLQLLKGVRAEADGRDAAWFNVADHYQRATTLALEARRSVLDALCDGTVWQREVDAGQPVSAVAERIFDVASLCARDEEHGCAVRLLRLYLTLGVPASRGSPLPAATVEAVERALAALRTHLGADPPHESEAKLSVAQMLLKVQRANPPWAGTFVAVCTTCSEHEMAAMRILLADGFVDPDRFAVGRDVLVYRRQKEKAVGQDKGQWMAARIVSRREVVKTKHGTTSRASVFDVALRCGEEMRGVEAKHVVASGVGGAGEVLRQAAAMGCAPLVDTLLDLGVSVFEADTLAQTPLHHAVKEGHAEICRRLRNAGADGMVPDLENQRAYDHAVRTQNHLCRRILTPSGVDLDLKLARGTSSEWLRAVEAGQIQEVQRLLEAGADVRDAPNEGGVNALMLAARGGSERMVGLLLDRSADVNARSRSGSNALIWAAIEDAADVVALLTQAGADANASDEEVFTPLMLAAAFGCEQVMGTLLRASADVEAVQFREGEAVGQSQCGRTALHWAAAMGEMHTAKLLLAFKANLEAKEKKREATPLTLACTQGHAKMALLLMDAGAVVDARTDHTAHARTPLLLACEAGHEAAARVLVQKGAAIDYQDALGYTAVMLAARGGFDATLRALVQLRAQVDLHTPEGTTALMLTSVGGHHRAAYALIEARAEVDAGTAYGKTALILACEHEQRSTLRLLLQAGASTEACDDDGRTALHAACEMCNLEMCKVLLMTIQLGSGIINRANLTGDPPLAVLLKRRAAFPLVELLISRRADINHAGQDGVTPLQLAQSPQSGYTGAEVQRMLECPEQSPSSPTRDAAETRG